MPKLLSKDNKVGLSYFGLIIVILVWGSAPLVATEINKAFSPSISMTIRGFLVAVFLFLISIKKLKLLNKRYFIVALSTGLFYAVASILQRFGLKSTTPSHYQFLENLSCLVVPFLMWWFIKKKPNVLTILSCIICLVSALISFFRTFIFEIGAILILPLILGEKGIWLAIIVAELSSFLLTTIFLKKNSNKYQYHIHI